MATTFRLGETEIDILPDGTFEAPREVLIHRGGDAARTALLARWGDRPMRVGVNAFLLRGPGGTILCDAGTGPTWGPRLGHAREALGRHGIAPRDVDRVLLTHIHGDHALGLLDGRASYFPRAELVVPEADIAFFTDPAAKAALPEARRAGFAIAATLVEAYAGRLRRVVPGSVLPGIALVPLPGHTPGQGGYLFTAEGAALMLWADALHLVEQVADPDIGLVYDIDPVLAARTRRDLLARAAAEDWVVCGGHMPGFARVAAEGAGFRLAPA